MTKIGEGNEKSLRLRRYTWYGMLGFSALIVTLTIAHYPSRFDDLSSENPVLDRGDYKGFYQAIHSDTQASPFALPRGDQGHKSDEHYPYVSLLTAFVRQYRIETARVLEVGSGTGKLQDVVADYTGLDISSEAGRYYRKPFVEASATSIPFNDGDFDVIWTINVLEHVPKPEQALSEMRRVLRDRGLLYLQAAWQCRPWAAEGYQVRPYSDFDIYGRLTKASIPLRDSAAYRALYVFPIRLLRLAASLATAGPTAFHYNTLTPNYERYWQPDSDAINSMDPYEVILWFTSRGDEVLAYDGPIHPFLVRTGAIVIRIRKPAK